MRFAPYLHVYCLVVLILYSYFWSLLTHIHQLQRVFRVIWAMHYSWLKNGLRPVIDVFSHRFETSIAGYVKTYDALRAFQVMTAGGRINLVVFVIGKLRHIGILGDLDRIPLIHAICNGKGLI